MKRKCLYAIIFLLFSIVAFPQSGSWKSYNTKVIKMLGVGKEKSKILKVKEVSKTVDIAIVEAKRDAVAFCLFSGISGTIYEDGIIPLAAGKEYEYSDFFNAFFKCDTKNKNYGDFTKFATCSRVPSGKDLVKNKGKFDVNVTIVVAYDNLRKYLEDNNIIQKMGEMAENAKKPTIIIFPSDNFCMENGFTSTYKDIDGNEKIYADYSKAFNQVNSEDFRTAYTQLSSMMKDRNFPVTNLEQAIKTFDIKQMELELIQSESGNYIKRSMSDIINNTIKADIKIFIDFSINKQGGEKYIHYNIQAVDAYTNSDIAGKVGDGRPSSYGTPGILLKEAVINYMDDFTLQMQEYYNDIVENGRETVLDIYIYENTDISFNSEYFFKDETVMLQDVINYWMGQNCVNKQYSHSRGSKNELHYKLRIPLFKKVLGEDKAIDLRDFIISLKKFLEEDPFYISSEIVNHELGYVRLILGEQ